MSEVKNRKRYIPPVYAIECRCPGMGIRYFSVIKFFGVRDITLNKYIKDAIFYLDHDIKLAEKHLKKNMNILDIESYDIIQVR